MICCICDPTVCAAHVSLLRSHVSSLSSARYEVVLVTAASQLWQEATKKVVGLAPTCLLLDLTQALVNAALITDSERGNFALLLDEFKTLGGVCVAVVEPALSDLRNFVEKMIADRGMQLVRLKSEGDIMIPAEYDAELDIIIDSRHAHLVLREPNKVPHFGSVAHHRYGSTVLKKLGKQCAGSCNREDVSQYAIELGNKLRRTAFESTNGEFLGSSLQNVQNLLAGAFGIFGAYRVHVMCESEALFGLPVDFMTYNESPIPAEAWAFKHAIIHQVPCHPTPTLRPGRQPRNLLLIDASAGEKVDRIRFRNGKSYRCKLGDLAAVREETGWLKDELSLICDTTHVHVEVLNTVKYDSIEAIDSFIQSLHKQYGMIDVVHYAGHSGKKWGRSFFHMPLSSNRACVLSPEELLTLFAQSNPWLMFLSSCWPGDRSTVFRIAQRIQFVVMHRWSVKDEHAKTLAKDFYASIFNDQVDVATALSMARRNRRFTASAYSALLVAGTMNSR